MPLHGLHLRILSKDDMATYVNPLCSAEAAALPYTTTACVSIPKAILWIARHLMGDRSVPVLGHTRAF